MKIILGTLFFVLLNGFSVTITAQDNCKVLMEKIAGTYQGDCKKGLAHGEGTAVGIDKYKGNFKKGLPDGVGTYTWKNGNRYEGEWKKGIKDGKGEMVYVLSQQEDSVVQGYWKEDTYLGVSENPYEIGEKSTNVTAVSVSRYDKIEDKSIEITVKLNTVRIQNPDVNVIVSTGNYHHITPVAYGVQLKNVQFPFKGRVSYGIHYVEITFFQPGIWRVMMEINEDRINY